MNAKHKNDDGGVLIQCCFFLEKIISKPAHNSYRNQ